MSLKKNSIYNMIKTFSSIIFPLITFPYVSRMLQPDNIGKVNFAITITSYFSLVASLGISTYAIRECSAHKDSKENLSNISSQLFSINFITTIFSFIGLTIALLFFKSLASYRMLIGIYSLTIIFTTLGTDWLNSAMEDFRYITIRSIMFQIISFILLLLLVRRKEDYYQYIAILAISSVGASIANIFYRKRFCNIKLTFKIDWKKHIAPIMLLFVMSLSATIMNTVDVTMLGFMKGDYEVGLYSTAHKVMAIVSQVVQSIIYVLIPRLSYYFGKKDYKNINLLLRKLLSFNIALGIPMVVGIIILSKDIMSLVGGAKYVEAAPVLSILILSFMFSLIGGSFLGNGILIPSKKEKYYMIVCCITALCNMLINYILIPPLGAIGAAIATAINGLLIFILLLLKIDKEIKIDRLISVFAPPILGSILILGICLIGKSIDMILLRVFFSCTMSAVVYFVILYICKYDLLIDIINPIIKKLRRD